jgi:hypothetical protein
MSLHPTNHKLPAVPRLSSRGRSSGEGFLQALPKLFKGWRAIVCGNPAAIDLHRAAVLEADLRSTIKACQRRVYDSITHAKARPADGGASADLAQPVPYAALHGETGEGFEAVRRRYDLPASMTVALSLGFLLPILAIVIARHGG